MISEELTNKRAEVAVKAMEGLQVSLQSFLDKGDAESASKVADSLTYLIAKSYEVEKIGEVAAATTKAGRTLEREVRNHRHGHNLEGLE